MILRLEQIVKRYARPAGDRVALDGGSLELARGEMVGVFGASGSGKTTLLRIACGLERPDSGVALYEGRPLEEMSAWERRRHLRREVGCVWTSAYWPAGLGVVEHVALPLLVDGCDRRAAQRRARELLEMCDAAHCAEGALPELSHGERQRVAIARALVIEPRLLLADGAVSNLSLLEQEAIMLLLGSLAREQKLAVLVTDSGAGAVLRRRPDPLPP